MQIYYIIHLETTVPLKQILHILWSMICVMNCSDDPLLHIVCHIQFIANHLIYLPVDTEHISPVSVG